VVQPFVTIGRERIATRERDLPHSRSLRNPAVVVPGTQIFTSQVRQGQQGFLNRAQTDVNLSHLSVNLPLRISGDHRMAIEDSNLVTQEASIVREVQYAVGQFLAERLGGSSGDHLAAIAAIPAVSDDPIGDQRRGDQLRNRIARDYVNVLRGQNRERVREELGALGINELATVGVGESYVISSLAGPEDRQGRIRDIASNRLFQASWSYHFGGVVASSGGDVITLENYARGGDEPIGPNPAADPRWYFQMYSQRNRGQTFHEFHSATRGYANPMTLALRRDADPDVLPLAPRRPAPPARRRPNPPRRLGRRHAIGGAAAVVLSVLLYQVIRSVLGSAA
jgi:hypothetical protein